MSAKNDPVLKKIVKYILKNTKPTSIILFGSRARGDHTVKSDYDIAVSGLSEIEYAKILNSLDDNDFTLKKIDLLKYENLNEDYLQKIKSEGITLYAK